MAITNTSIGQGADTNPPSAYTVPVAVNGTGGAGSDLIFVAMFIGSNITTATISDNKNSGNYTKIASWAEGGGNVMMMWMMVQQSNVAANTLVITPANTGANQGQIYVGTFTGFNGIPTVDSTLGEVDNTLASGQPASTNVAVFTTQNTNFANEIAFSTNDCQNTQPKGAPAPNDGAGNNWTQISTSGGISWFHIIGTSGQPMKFQFQFQAATTATTYFQLVGIYDAPVPFGTVVQSNSFNDTSITLTHTITLPNRVVAGDMLLLATTAHVVSSISDNLNGAWGVFDVHQDGQGPDVYIFSRPNSAAGNVTVTITLNSAGALAYWLGEVAGVAPVNTLDATGQNASNVGGIGTLTSGPTSRPILYSTEFMICAAGYPTTTTPTATSGFTLDPKGNVTKLAVATQVSAQAVAQTGGFTVSPTVNQYSCVIATYIGTVPVPIGSMTPCMVQSMVQ